jgi:hypothetical protein
MPRLYMRVYCRGNAYVALTGWAGLKPLPRPLPTGEGSSAKGKNFSITQKGISSTGGTPPLLVERACPDVSGGRGERFCPRSGEVPPRSTYPRRFYLRKEKNRAEARFFFRPIIYRGNCRGMACVARTGWAGGSGDPCGRPPVMRDCSCGIMNAGGRGSPLRMCPQWMGCRGVACNAPTVLICVICGQTENRSQQNNL